MNEEKDHEAYGARDDYLEEDVLMIVTTIVEQLEVNLMGERDMIAKSNTLTKNRTRVFTT